jgi:glycerol-3-phosphate O-acyltransferase
VLLSHDRRAMSEGDVLPRAEFLHGAALDAGAHADPGEVRGRLLRAIEILCGDATLKRHQAGGERFYSVPEDRRIPLDYQKNAILHFLLAPAILALALRTFRGQAAPLPELMRRAKDASRLLKHEFVYPPGKSFESTVDETFALLLRWGLVERAGEAVLPVARGVRMLSLLAELLRPFLEGIWVAADALQLLLPAPMPSKEWNRQALDRGRAAYLAGRVLRLEALTKPTLDNAIMMYRDRGVIIGANVSLTADYAAREKVLALAEEVSQFLR